MAIPVYSTGDVPTADEVNTWFVNTMFARKAITENISSSTSLHDDADLKLTLPANATYHATILLRMASQTTVDVATSFVGPAGCSFNYVTNGIVTAGASFSDDLVGTFGIGSTVTYGGLGGTTSPAIIEGLVTMAATAGVFKLQWAQGVSNASGTSMLFDSFMSLRRVA